jgi:hypothetical protein
MMQRRKAMHVEPEASYRAYMLRLWRVQGEQGPNWRATLEDAQTGERRGFPDLEALCRYLTGLEGPIERSDPAAKE